MKEGKSTMTLTDPWLPILNSLKLSRAERMVVDRYMSAPQGRTFLPIADILLSHGLVDDCIELLMQGVERHPGFTVARVILARELFHKGMMVQAWNTLEQSPEPLTENVLAQKIRFKLALLLNKEDLAKEIHAYIQSRRMGDDEIRRLGEILDRQGFAVAARTYREDLAKAGIQVRDDDLDLMEPARHATPEPPRLMEEEDVAEEAVTNPLAGFHVVPLKEIFALAMEGELRGPNAAVELDSTTLAEIYESQGHYQKSLEIYRRLLRVSPNNEYLKRKVSEVNRRKLEQKDRDFDVDPGIVEQMESLEILNNQIRYLNDLLVKIG